MQTLRTGCRPSHKLAPRLQTRPVLQASCVQAQLKAGCPHAKLNFASKRPSLTTRRCCHMAPTVPLQDIPSKTTSASYYMRKRVANAMAVYTSTVVAIMSDASCQSGPFRPSVVCQSSQESAAPSDSGSAEGDNKARVREQLSKLNQEADELAAELKEARQAYKGDLQNNKLERLYEDAQRRYDQLMPQLSERRKALEAQLTDADKLSMLQRFELPFPPNPYRPPPATPGTAKHPPPTTTPEVWDVADRILQDADAFLSSQPQDATFNRPLPNTLTSESEVGIKTAMTNQLSVVQMAMRLASLAGEWVQEPPNSSSSSSPDPSPIPISVAAAGPGKQAPPPAPTKPVKVQGEAQLARKQPDWELRAEDGSYMTFMEAKVPPLLEGAGDESLAVVFQAHAEAPKPRAGRPKSGEERPFGKVKVEDLRNILGQVEVYCRERRVRYFAITTYNMTWVGKIEGKKMLISRGFRWCDRGLTVLKVLLWLVLQVQGPDRFLRSEELPPRSPAPSPVSPAPDTDDSSDGSAAAAGQGHDAAAAAAAGQPPSGSGDRTAGSQDGNGSAVLLQWEVELPSSPGAGVLGSGITGDVLAGSVGDIPLAVKWGPAATKYERWLEREGHVYMDMQPLQGKYIPVLQYFGSAAGGMYMLLTHRVFGRHLRGGGRDAHLLPKALDALRAVHSMGYLHGDVRLPNFLAVDEQQVFVLDFGNAQRSFSRRDMQQEEEELIALLQEGEPSPVASRLAHRPVFT